MYKVGDKIIVNESCLPSYYRGLIGEIIKIEYTFGLPTYLVHLSDGKECTMVNSDISPYDISPTNPTNNLNQDNSAGLDLL